ncbi:MAG: hypothetical protein COW11_03775 [Candidatus Omnitrophica bacterium CG12_big_fil_rev_8_21_14_0_65_43_15]|uniref:DUF2934 domain-containing protein n=1 Tax=Candidatus Taenaricola geysiri TaxID=1974752 RepID=A0A2J0LL73_9BACT|nr:MAG: hypothetical protein AUJ89_05280 [Candidatus Omnitrophica bacterium CG1_02_43_210]PIR65736.1 MAG: hypothetical protein COU52_02690 [Candidatus Omnitrophica bacterium CG10_big_fil_rev_8_21_14_0_10_43_8]PIV11770.1 MAG: hypothetical protein COS48_04355 [Candidatus Omnitrophica bacterium CG03_land_8_20_14_0_80_43_22]PIW66363.1 MAG: hypothetical protein COW11_03775 [Candidatus Omnitrophica bacterium CG12_big_fil_rev_8_21_14_0_65_43_15]PIW80963.1 MAG: hypothetical protein COZ98_00105 [Candida
MPEFNLWEWMNKGGDSFMLRTKKKNTTTNKSQDTSELIAKKAYELYEKRGCEHGSDFNDWVEAERLVKNCARQKSYR